MQETSEVRPVVLRIDVDIPCIHKTITRTSNMNDWLTIIRNSIIISFFFPYTRSTLAIPSTQLARSNPIFDRTTITYILLVLPDLAVTTAHLHSQQPTLQPLNFKFYKSNAQFSNSKITLI